MNTEEKQKTFEAWYEEKFAMPIDRHSILITAMYEGWQARAELDDDLRSIFKRIVDIIGFHNGDDAEKVEAIRQVMLTAKHLQPPKQQGESK